MESAKSASLGSSLLVPSVQELIKTEIGAVPPRYLRPDQDQPIVSDADVPIVDLGKLVDEATMDSELAILHSACKDWGFFQLVNHGVSSTVVDNMKTQVQEFFNLPMEEKQKFWQSPGEVEGFGQSFVVSEEQKLDWADLFFLVTQPPQLRKPHLLPKLPLPFRQSTGPNGESLADETRGDEGHFLREHKADNEDELLPSVPPARQGHRPDTPLRRHWPHHPLTSE
ncbi:unnamed protein product [Linum tenue]|uniref:Non-haem dioxygenase N-terminal domain-containing protein n=1 Tax=Linum tenue TaxID=586396 RepID=A0AAV0P776_9ROSI|nr:unnamed protein product [Linum tenue]